MNNDTHMCLSRGTGASPLSAEEDDEGDTADHRDCTAQRCNGSQRQQVAHWSRLHFLSGDTQQ